MRDIQEPTLNDKGDEVHPAFGNVTVANSMGGDGVLYDSEVRHQHTVVLRIQRSKRHRDLNRDWLHGDSMPLIEIQMSQSQWAEMISSIGSGGGTACTIRYTKEDGPIPAIPYAPRMANSIAEVEGAADRAMERIKGALATYKDHKTVGNLRALDSAINGVTNTLSFAAESLSEHVEDTLARARADIEAMVNARARDLGIDPGDITLALEAGESSE